jgi:hypothetical protein
MLDRLTMHREKIIWVEEINAMVFLVREPGHLWGDCEVVYVEGKPSWHRHVHGTGETWAFPEGSLGASPHRDHPWPPLLRTLWCHLRGK